MTKWYGELLNVFDRTIDNGNLVLEIMMELTAVARSMIFNSKLKENIL